MKKRLFNHAAVYGCCVALAMLAATIQTAAQSGDSGNVKTSITKVITFGGSSVIPAAGATLSRNNDGVYAAISTSGITPGHVVTLWWVFFNSPKACAAAVCAPPDLNNPEVNGSLQYGGGYLVGVNGRADFGGYLGAGDNTGFYLLPMFPNMPNPAPGLVNPKGAEVHLVIRDHGPASADPAILHEQLSSFPGGCSLYPCANIQAAIFAR